MIKYNVDKEKGVVVAYLQLGCEECFPNAADMCIKLNDLWCEFIKTDMISHNKFWNGLDDVWYGGTIRGIARCHPDDEWNEEVGRRIAKEKLLNKLQERRRKAYTFLYTTLQGFAEDVANKGEL